MSLIVESKRMVFNRKKKFEVMKAIPEHFARIPKYDNDEVLEKSLKKTTKKLQFIGDEKDTKVFYHDPDGDPTIKV